jgi:hypothetical protein
MGTYGLVSHSKTCKIQATPVQRCPCILGALSFSLSLSL